jgi:alpha-L-rhamnosidase
MILQSKIFWPFLNLQKTIKMKITTIIIAILFSVNAIAQEVTFSASWISAEDIELKEHNVIHLRKTIEFEKVPENFRVKISADNQYRLFINGKYICKGPGRSDLEHWYYQTLDLAPHFKTGKNLVAVEVVNFGPRRGFSQLSHLTAFFMEGETEAEKIINTGSEGWKAINNEAYFERIVRWQHRIDITQGLYVANPTDSIAGNKFLWGWEKPEYNDSKWKPAKYLDISSYRYNNISGMFYPDGWLLVERPIKNQTEKREDFADLYNWNGLTKIESLKKFRLPANQKISILMDNRVMTLGFPELIVSGGKGSHIKVSYSETLFHTNRIGKDDRSKIEGNQLIGVSDIFMPDGGQNRLFRPNWFRSFRYIQIDIQTGKDPLEIVDFYNQKSEYPIELKATFETDNPFLNSLMEPGWRTASLCAQDLLMSDAHYEQMQYIGDARIHGEAIQYFSGNDDLVRQMLVQADWSKIPEGLTRACYPDGFNLTIPIYSLVWIDIIHDHMMWAGDKEFTSQFDIGIYTVLEWFSKKIQSNGLTGPIDWWAYADWCVDWKSGVPPGGLEGNSALFTLHFAYTLQNAAKIYRFIGKEHLADIYDKQAKELVKSVNELCWNSEKQLYSDTPEMKYYSQHTNIFAVLAGAAQGEKAQKVLSKIFTEKGLSEIGLYFHHYLFEAFNKAGIAAEFQNHLAGWKEMLDNNLSTFTEVALTGNRTQRSDCHPWSCSPNINFFKTICGIQPEKAGFEKVLIEPNPGNLKFINASFNHPKGYIKMKLKFDGQKVSGEITIPENMETTFHWYGQSQKLKQGINQVQF